jgi:hypothetical protein
MNAWCNKLLFEEGPRSHEASVYLNRIHIGIDLNRIHIGIAEKRKSVFTAAKHTGRRTAVLDKALSDWTPVEHANKGSDFVHSRRCDFANRRHLVNNLFLLVFLRFRYYVLYPNTTRLRVRTVLDV